MNDYLITTSLIQVFEPPMISKNYSIAVLTVLEVRIVLDYSLSVSKGDGVNSEDGLTILQAREILGERYRGLSDLEIDQIRISCEILARVALTSFRKKLAVESGVGGTDNG